MDVAAELESMCWRMVPTIALCIRDGGTAGEVGPGSVLDVAVESKVPRAGQYDTRKLRCATPTTPHYDESAVISTCTRLHVSEANVSLYVDSP